jgi:bla regulator protein BlaR1
MTDFILQVMLSNLLVSLILAVIALVLQRRYRAVSLANIIWVMVLVKLLTPPLVSVPLLEVESLTRNAPTTLSRTAVNEGSLHADVALPHLEDSKDLGAMLEAFSVDPLSVTREGVVSRLGGAFGLGVVWISVSALLLIISLLRIVRFHIQVHRQCRSAEPWVLQLGHSVAATIGLRCAPRIDVLPANISPFVWWLGGKPRIFLSQLAIDNLQASELRLILAHEMVHIKRLDHFVRWLEWLASATLWWNPVMWLARQQLRATEEIACDAMVIQLTGVPKFDYASSLLSMAEILTKSTIRPPTVASEFNSGGVLEKRLSMIISNEKFKITQWMRMLTIALAVCIFPVGLVYAQDYGAVQRRLVEAVKAGELSREQVAPMMEALKKNAKPVVVQGEDAAKRDRYNAGAKRIEEAIKSGRVSKADGEKRLTEMRKQMFPVRGNKDAKSDRANAGDMEAKKRRYMAGAEKIEAMVKAGKLSKEDAEKKLIEMRTKMFKK